MQYSAAVVVVLTLLAGAAIGSDVEDAKNSVSKVITLLKDVVSQLAKDAEEGEEVYETIGCRCGTIDKDKAKAISHAQRHIADLTAAIEGYISNSAQLNTEIEDLNKEIEKNQGTDFWTKQLDEFNAEEDEDAYKTRGCWYGTHDKEKTKAISDAQRHIADLTAAIEVYTEHSSRLNTEIEDLNKENAKNQGVAGGDDDDDSDDDEGVESSMCAQRGHRSVTDASVMMMMMMVHHETDDEDFCIEELYNNEYDTEMKERDRNFPIAKIDDLTMAIDTQLKDIGTFKGGGVVAVPRWAFSNVANA